MNISSAGAVIIGRNEGERLRICLQSVRAQFDNIVYVDSGSTDGSVLLAHDLGAVVVELEPQQPFTAARARNAGLRRLSAICPEIQLIQFIDGDCELVAGWLAHASNFLANHAEVAVACGRRRERYPNASVFNRLCDIEWDTPIGPALSCGGDALFRIDALTRAQGFCEDMIAGEEPDLCFRLRRMGWEVVRLDAEMSWHDASMHRFGQWWQRTKRSGYAAMEASVRRGSSEPHLRRLTRSNLLWSLPVAWPLWPVLWLRVRRRRGSLYATHIVAGKVPHLVGQLTYLTRRRRRPKLIEYK